MKVVLMALELAFIIMSICLAIKGNHDWAVGIILFWIINTKLDVIDLKEEIKK